MNKKFIVLLLVLFTESLPNKLLSLNPLLQEAPQALDQGMQEAPQERFSYDNFIIIPFRGELIMGNTRSEAEQWHNTCYTLENTFILPYTSGNERFHRGVALLKAGALGSAVAIGGYTIFLKNKFQFGALGVVAAYLYGKREFSKINQFKEFVRQGCSDLEKLSQLWRNAPRHNGEEDHFSYLANKFRERREASESIEKYHSLMRWKSPLSLPYKDSSPEFKEQINKMRYSEKILGLIGKSRLGVLQRTYYWQYNLENS